MSLDNEIENTRLRIMNEMNGKFDDMLRELHSNGTEFSRHLSHEIENDRIKITKELEDIWKFSKSKLISIETAQEIFYKEILPKLMDKIDVSVGMARDSASSTALALKSNRATEKGAERAEDAAGRAEDALRSSNWQTAGIIVAICLAILTGGLKLWQDWANQKETAGYLEALNTGVKIVQSLEERAKKLGSQQIPEVKTIEGK